MLIVPSLLLPLIPELGLPPEIVILSMASGTFLISHVNDPFFWIFGELAELEPSEVFIKYPWECLDGYREFSAGICCAYLLLLSFFFTDFFLLLRVLTSISEIFPALPLF